MFSLVGFFRVYVFLIALYSSAISHTKPQGADPTHPCTIWNAPGLAVDAFEFGSNKIKHPQKGNMQVFDFNKLHSKNQLLNPKNDRDMTIIKLFIVE